MNLQNSFDNMINKNISTEMAVKELREKMQTNMIARNTINISEEDLFVVWQKMITFQNKPTYITKVDFNIKENDNFLWVDAITIVTNMDNVFEVFLNNSELNTFLTNNNIDINIAQEDRQYLKFKELLNSETFSLELGRFILKQYELGVYDIEKSLIIDGYDISNECYHFISNETEGIYSKRLNDYYLIYDEYEDLEVLDYDIRNSVKKMIEDKLMDTRWLNNIVENHCSILCLENQNKFVFSTNSEIDDGDIEYYDKITTVKDFKKTNKEDYKKLKIRNMVNQFRKEILEKYSY